MKHNFIDMDVAKYDATRDSRNGFSEVILCEGKKLDHLLKIIDGLMAKEINIFGTRVNEEVGNIVCSKFSKAKYDETSRTFSIINKSIKSVDAKLGIICAGTSDISVAEEAVQTALFHGIEAVKFYDVGVAGIHRLLSHVEELKKLDVAIVVAGMEGALPSVVGGLVSCPIIAVPTSVGYGTNFKGVTALFAMLNSCSEGITVVNIDNGFGAACAALRILKTKN